MKKKINPLELVLTRSRSAIWGVGLISCVINLLMLTGPLFMLQIYDRVLSSRSVPTLVALFALVVFLYGILGLLEFLRSKILSRIGSSLDVNIMTTAKAISLRFALFSKTQARRPLSDLTFLRQFIGSNGLPAIFDLPWVPIYLGILFLLHFQLGAIATGGVAIVLLLTVINELLTRSPIAETSSQESTETSHSEINSRNAEPIIAMGMVGNITQRWEAVRHQTLVSGQTVSNITSIITATTKTIRLILQSGILALGAYLAIYQEITAGTMIAGSILAGRALAPIDLAIGNWKNFIKARHSFHRLRECLIVFNSNTAFTDLPTPKGSLILNSVTKLAPMSSGKNSHSILQDLTFQLSLGDGLGVIGPSGSGKSSLARILVGLWSADRGDIRLDEASYNQWDMEVLGKHIGYLPQTVELLPGTIAENIARFNQDANDDETIAAAKLAGVHDLILNLPDGYETKIIPDMAALSAGQVQRIALARAVFRTPALIVLDEPNSNLDAEGDIALANAIKQLRSQNSTIIVMAHRPSALSEVNKILMLKAGRQVAFGDKDEVLSKVTHLPNRPFGQVARKV